MLLLRKANFLVNFAIGILIWTFSLIVHALELKVAHISNPEIEQKIRFAAQSWEMLLTDPIRVNIRIEFSVLEDNIRAHTSAEYVDITFTQFKQALAADKKAAQINVF